MNSACRFARGAVRAAQPAVAPRNAAQIAARSFVDRSAARAPAAGGVLCRVSPTGPNPQLAPLGSGGVIVTRGMAAKKGVPHHLPPRRPSPPFHIQWTRQTPASRPRAACFRFCCVTIKTQSRTLFVSSRYHAFRGSTDAAWHRQHWLGRGLSQVLLAVLPGPGPERTAAIAPSSQLGRAGDPGRAMGHRAPPRPFARVRSSCQMSQ